MSKLTKGANCFGRTDGQIGHYYRKPSLFKTLIPIQTQNITFTFNHLATISPLSYYFEEMFDSCNILHPHYCP